MANNDMQKSILVHIALYVHLSLLPLS